MREPQSMASSLKTTLGLRVREIRHARGLSQEALAEELGFTARYLAGIERGERNLTLDSVEALAFQLQVDASTLITTAT